MDEIFELYEQYGSADYIGETLTQTEHMIQTAMLAEEYTQSVEIVLAALFHDIGHLLGIKYAKEGKMGPWGVKSHEGLGATYLKEKGFSERMVSLVRNHVNAKRYLTYKNPDYMATLSEASQKTLKYQGGPMSPQEASEFEQDPDFELILKLREWDDSAKKNISIKSLDYYKQLATHVIPT